MHLVREAVAVVVLEVVFQVVHVHVAVGKGLARCKVEVSDDLVHADPAFDSAAFHALRVEVFGVVFALALLYAFAAAKGPRDGRIGFAHFVAGVAAARFLCLLGGGSTVAFAAVVGVKMRGIVLVSVGKD